MFTDEDVLVVFVATVPDGFRENMLSTLQSSGHGMRDWVDSCYRSWHRDPIAYENTSDPAACRVFRARVDRESGLNEGQINYIVNNIKADRSSISRMGEKVFAEIIWRNWNADPMPTEKKWGFSPSLRSWFRSEVMLFADPRHWSHWTPQEILDHDG